MNDITLAGCAPESLMNYLKALGVFRLVTEQADAGATLSWKGGMARLTSRLDRDGLAAFFRDDYRPTPIVVPWSGGDFFGINPNGDGGPFKKAPTSTRVIEAILATDSPRLESYRATIRLVIDTMQACGILTKATIEGAANKVRKAAFIARLRAWAREDVVEWIDAAVQSREESAVFNPLLGSGGGNDGNTHFSDNFMQNLWDCLPDFDHQRQNSDQPRPDVRHALFNDLEGTLVERTGALYDSGAVGGPNATQGFIRQFLVDPWNFVLAMEGLLIYAGGVAKKLGSHSREAPSFPFLVRMTAAGSEFGSAVLKEYGQYEVWLPLWDRHATFAELGAFFREGRAQVGRRPAQTGTDMSRAVSTKGVSAGIERFCRYGLIRGRVGGDNYFTAASIGRYRVRFDSSVTLLDQIDPWLIKFGYAIRDDDTPAQYRSIFQRLDTAVSDHCRGQAPGSHGPLQPVLAMLGRVERVLASGLSFCKEKGIRPLQGLNRQWLEYADDDSREFRLAVSLAGIQPSKKREVGPLRVFLEQVEVTKFVNWHPGSTSAVWSNRPLIDNLTAVFRRRQMEAFRAGLNGVPLSSLRQAKLADVLAFLNGETDDDKLTALLWALTTLAWSNIDFQLQKVSASDDLELPFEFGVLRLLVEPLPLVARNGRWSWDKSGEPTTPDPDVFHLLASGQSKAVGLAVDQAARRLKSDGRLVNGYRNRQQSGKFLEVASRFSADRLLAAMLFPLSNYDLVQIANTVLYVESEA